MTLTVRDADPADAPVVASVQVRGWRWAYRGQLPDSYLAAIDEERRRQMWDRTIRDPGATLLVAVDNGNVVGFVAAAESPDEGGIGQVFAIYLGEEADAGRGYGHALLAAAEERLHGAGFDEAVLWVLATNDRARQFYERHGWRADGGSQTEHQGDVELFEVRYRKQGLSYRSE